MRDDTFVKVTNKEVYEEIRQLRDEIRKQHEEVRSRLDVTNGKVKRGLWIASTALSISIILMGFLFQHLQK